MKRKFKADVVEPNKRYIQAETSASSESYFTWEGIRKIDQACYCAAGILLVQRIGNIHYVLLVDETRQNIYQLNLPGGKSDVKQDQGDAWKTATREFWEATGKLVSCETIRTTLVPMASVWKAQGKYIAYICNVDSASEEWARTLDVKFFALSRTRNQKEQQQLRWISVASIYNSEKTLRALVLSQETKRTKTTRISPPLYELAQQILFMDPLRDLLFPTRVVVKQEQRVIDDNNNEEFTRAGILLVSKFQGESYVCLAMQRNDLYRETLVLIHGPCSTPQEDPWETATREFYIRLAKFVPLEMIRALCPNNSWWDKQHRLVIFVCQVDEQQQPWIKDLDLKFNRDVKNDQKPDRIEHLRWVSVTSIKEKLKDPEVRLVQLAPLASKKNQVRHSKKTRLVIDLVSQSVFDSFL